MSFFYYMFIALCGLVSFISYRKYKYSGSRIYVKLVVISSVALFSVIFIKIFLGILFFFFWPGERRSLFNKEYKYMEYAGEYLAGYLVDQNYYGNRKKILIIDYPAGKRLPGSSTADALIEGIRRRVEFSDYKICAIEKPIPSKDPKKYWFSAAEIDRIVNKHPDVAIVISLVGLPRDLAAIDFWRREDPPKVALFAGKLKYLEMGFEYDVIVAALIFKPGTSFKNAKYPTKEDWMEYVKKHFILVTPYSLYKVKEKYPNLFYNW